MSAFEDRRPVPDRFGLVGKVAVVTGATQNIGLEIARAFAYANATVVLAARRRDVLDRRVAELQELGVGEVLGVPTDVTSADDIASLTGFVNERFGQADVLVNNAYSSGSTFGIHPLEIDDAAWEETFQANMLGPYRLIRGLGRRMAEGRGGSVINVLSGSGFLPSQQVMPYGSTKAGLWMMTRYLADSCAPEIRVNGLCPGITMSDTGGPSVSGPIQALLDATPMRRAGDPSEVAAAALFLASDAASYTTGTVLFVNGGRPW